MEHDLSKAASAVVRTVAAGYGAQTISRLLEFEPLTCLNELPELAPWLAARRQA